MARTAVVLVPGDASNRLYARLDKPRVVRPWCARTSSTWLRLWLRLASLLNPLELPCWCDNMQLRLNATTRALRNAPGVRTRVFDFGGTSSMELLDPSLPARATAVWAPMVASLVHAGLERNVSLRGAPYDFRLSPRTDTAYFDALARLIDATSDAHGGQPVVLVSHSLGCLQVHAFLRARSAEWRARRVRTWVAIAGPYGGTTSLLRLHASGDAQGLPVSSLALREQQRSYESNAWMLPQPALWAGAGALATTRARAYTADELPAFLDDARSRVGVSLLDALGPLRAGFDAPPRVAVECVFSTGVPTAERFDWRAAAAGFDEQPVELTGDGDGTVNARSLSVCARWVGAQAEAVRVRVLHGVRHRDMVMDQRVVQLVLTVAGLAPAPGPA